MKLLDTLAQTLGFVRNPNTRPIGARGFKGGEVGRLTNSWTLRDGSINADLYSGLRIMRARSRDLFANNEFAKQFAHLARGNVVGSKGFVFRNRARRSDTNEIDSQDNRRIEDLFRDFSKAQHFTVTGKLSRRAFEALVVETWMRDGEYLIHKTIDNRRKHGLALKLLDIDRLDIEKNEQAQAGTGNRVIMGVEVDADMRPVAYWLLKSHPHPGPVSDLGGDRHVRILAEEIIHGFTPMRAEQVRGVPWLHAAMVALWDTGGWREAAIINARISANKLGFISGENFGGYGPEQGMVTDIDSLGYQINDSEPGEWHVLPPGVSVEQHDGAYPHQMFAEFNKAMLRGISAGMGTAYHSISNDLESVNFATGKIGLLAEREMWTMVQEDLAETLNDGYFPDWLRWAVFSGALAPIPASEQAFQLNNQPTWKGRRWPSAEPLKDAQANALNIGMKLTSPRRLMEQQGLDPDDEWQVMAEDQQTLRDLGLAVTLPNSVQVLDEAANEED